ncbi:MAG TPA: valine--tRNA ligase [Puia sp.]|jgi:valyl-tRNA synthetase|nr:valine--tRNA ligase [Puia sp.]
MELSKHYDPASTEDKWSAHWLSKNYFKSEPDENKKPFTLVIPPPNVTGVLHMGHTLNETVQDILARKARMNGFNVCWVPGSDHASIATEARVVNMLKEKGIEKDSLTREQFLKYAFEWKEKYGGIIYNQIKKLGCSVDWDRVTFTMDDHYYKAVIKVFVELYNKGLIYRGARMINWDPSAKTALSDEEVEHKDVQGKLYYVKYYVKHETTNEKSSHGSRLTAHDEFVIIATQRPETIMGDTAVCVNPNDNRYAYLKNKKVIVPLVNREVPVIFDDYVDATFGTGALKVTPAHDINDYNLGIKYNLPIIDTLNEDGTLSAAAEVFVGLDRFEARKKVVEQLKADGLLVKEEDYQTRVGFSQRTNAVVEPKISTQWFLKMKELAGPALNAVVSGEIKIHPEERFINTYKYWLENVKDWCISRQLWWGQQIPAWYDANGNVYVAESLEEANGQRSTANGQLTQDQDVLDTWFSSWLWPIEVFNGITEPGNKDFNYYYPTSVLVTGQDIIFFWVARMIMAGYQFENKKPFSDVYFTGMVRDKQGRKMSKSLGNSPDLLELIDKYGADAVRFGIMIASPAGNDLLFDESSLEQGRNFNNKLWNALKLVKMWSEKTQETSDKEQENFAVDWFENRLNEAKMQVDVLYKDFKLSEALKTIYSLIWDDFCSWYLEWIKPEFQQPIAKNIFDKTIYFFEELIQILHPFMPFITEEIYHLLKERNDDLCVKQSSQVGDINTNIFDKIKLLKDIITKIRDLKRENDISLKERMMLEIATNKSYLFEQIIPILFKQLNIETISLNDVRKIGDLNNIPILEDLNNLDFVVDEHQFTIKVFFALNKEKQKDGLVKDIEYQKGFLNSVNKKLTNEKFVQNAKPEVIALEEKKKADAEAKIKALEESLANLQ